MLRSRSRRLGAVALALATLAANGVLATTASGSITSGYWLVGADGGVYEFGGAPFKGSLTGTATPAPIVGMAATPSGRGYWLVATDGGMSTFGDAGSHGSMRGHRLYRPIVSMAPTPTGGGYWMAAADGGVFAFGDARFFGSMGGETLNRPVVGMAATPSGGGYWLVASDGGIFAFGDARFRGSAASRNLTHPVVSMAVTATGGGYWLTDSDGGVYNFGDAVHSGSAAACPLPAGIVGMATSGEGTGSDAPRPNCGLPTTTTTTSTTRTTSSSSSGGSRFEIGLVGDTGYDSEQESQFLKARSHMNRYPLAFVVHDGDFKSGTSSCSDWRYRQARDVFNGFEAPFIYTPGDNEWSDCSDEKGRLAFLRSTFFPTDYSLGEHKIRLTRQHSTYVENARWTKSNVVFVTLNVPGSDGRSGSNTESNARIAADVAWLNAAFDLAQGNKSPGLMVIFQDNPFRTGEPSIMSTLKSRTIKFGKPVVLVHGDTHVHRLDHPWSDVDNFTRLETYATTSSNKWVRATVDPASSKVFSFSSMTAS